MLRRQVYDPFYMLRYLPLVLAPKVSLATEVLRRQ